MGLEERWGPDGIERLRELYEPLRRFAAVVGRLDVDPDDLVQNAFAKVLSRHSSDIRELGPYLRRTIVNLATDERRRFTRTDNVLRRIGAPPSPADAYPSDLEDLMRVQPRVRALLYLVEIEGQPIADAADVIGMSNASARVALMRARRRLRAELTMEANGE
ncbi:MAG TPA: sigma factor-like helix-turn-helix DNA-binding protein [Acidimicrobiia bacterium]